MQIIKTLMRQHDSQVDLLKQSKDSIQKQYDNLLVEHK